MFRSPASVVCHRHQPPTSAPSSMGSVVSQSTQTPPDASEANFESFGYLYKHSSIPVGEACHRHHSPAPSSAVSHRTQMPPRPSPRSCEPFGYWKRQLSPASVTCHRHQSSSSQGRRSPTPQSSSQGAARAGAAAAAQGSQSTQTPPRPSPSRVAPRGKLRTARSPSAEACHNVQSATAASPTPPCGSSTVSHKTQTPPWPSPARRESRGYVNMRRCPDNVAWLRTQSESPTSSADASRTTPLRIHSPPCPSPAMCEFPGYLPSRRSPCWLACHSVHHSAAALCSSGPKIQTPPCPSEAKREAAEYRPKLLSPASCASQRRHAPSELVGPPSPASAPPPGPSVSQRSHTPPCDGRLETRASNV
mmetsp:Transcript_72343/g.209430  ORF Transcript_72343/g.209430 Transcript_72343/m.209430 type:complete len:363 (-) Transcript_72343:478-1566(-)